MAINGIRVVLAADHLDGHAVKRQEFLKTLGVDAKPYRLYGRAAPWTTVGLVVCDLSLVDFHDRDEPSEGLEESLQAALADFARWLSHIPAVRMKALQTGRLHAYVLVHMDINHDQMEFNLPVALAGQMGRLRLPLHMISNE